MVTPTFDILEKIMASGIVVNKRMIAFARKLIKENINERQLGLVLHVSAGINCKTAERMLSGIPTDRGLDLLEHLDITPDKNAYFRLRSYYNAMRQVTDQNQEAQSRYFWAPTSTPDEKRNKEQIELYRKIFQPPVPDFLEADFGFPDDFETEEELYSPTTIAGVSLEDPEPLSPLELCLILGIDHDKAFKEQEI